MSFGFTFKGIIVGKCSIARHASAAWIRFVLHNLSTSTLSPPRSGDPGVGKSCLLRGFMPELVGVDTPFLMN